MYFELQAVNFKFGQSFLFQTQDQQAKAERMFEFVAEQLKTKNFQIFFYYQNGQSTLLNQGEDLKFYMDQKGWFFIFLHQENQVAINIYIGEPPNLIYGEYADPNVLLGQYLLYLGQNFNIIADCFSLYDTEGNLLTSNSNEYIRNYRNFQPLNLVLYQQQAQNQQIQYDQQLHDLHNLNINQIKQHTQPLIQDAQNEKNQQNYQQGIIGIEGAPKQASQQNQIIYQNQLQGQPITQDAQNQNIQQNLIHRISEVKDSIKIFKNYTLYFDCQGQFVVYHYHKPIMLKGSLRKSSSTSRSNISISKWYSVHQNKFGYAELDEYSFAIKWEGGNLSYIKIKQL